jgi:hypothetical protein
VTAPAATLALFPEPGTPLWWLRRMHKALVEQQAHVEFFDDYYRGDHPLPWLPSQAVNEFRRILRMTRSNYMGLVCDATAERCSIEGFRMPGEKGADGDTRRIWEANSLDADSDKVILEALITRASYMLVQPNGSDTPDVFAEDPAGAIVAYVPGSNRRKRAAGLKVFLDDWTGDLFSTLYLPTWIYKFQAPAAAAKLDPERVQWSPRVVAGEASPVRNILGEVPLVEWPNNPRLRHGGVSELADVTDVQDRINKTIADRLITQDFGAFPQKWATGFPDDGDQPFDVGRDRLVATDVQETKFGQFEAAALDPYSSAKKEDVHDIAARTRTPAQYLLGEMSNVNGETLKASESGLVSKVRQRMRSYEEAAEETVRLARLAAGLAVPPEGLECIWKNPEFRTEAEVTDAAVKQLAAGIRDLRSAREFVGLSQTEIQAMEDREAANGDTLDATLSRILRPVPGQTTPAVTPNASGAGPA